MNKGEILDRERFVQWLLQYRGVVYERGKDGKPEPVAGFIRTSPCYCPLGVYIREQYPEGGVGMVQWWEAANLDLHVLPDWAIALRHRVDSGGKTESGMRKLAITRNEVMAILVEIDEK